MARRTGLYDAIDSALDRGAFGSSEEAETFALEKANLLKEVRENIPETFDFINDVESTQQEVAH